MITIILSVLMFSTVVVPVTTLLVIHDLLIGIIYSPYLLYKLIDAIIEISESEYLTQKLKTIISCIFCTLYLLSPLFIVSNTIYLSVIMCFHYSMTLSIYDLFKEVYDLLTDFKKN